MSRRVPGAALGALAVGGALLLAGCGGGGSSDADPATRTSAAGSSSSAAPSDSPGDSASSTGGTAASPSLGPTSSATGAAFGALDGQVIADTAKAAMLGLTAVHYRGNVASSNTGGTITLDLRADTDGDCTGTLGVQGGRVTLLSAGGQSYFKGDRKFWEAAAGDAGDQIFTGIDGRWVLDTNQDFSQFCNLGDFLGNLFSTSDGSTYATGSTRTVAGQDVIAVTRTSGDQSASTGFVQTGARHYLVRIERTSGTQQGRLDFSDFDQPVRAQAPAAADIVDPSTLASTAPSSSAS